MDAPDGVNASLSDPVFMSLWVEAINIARDFQPEYFSLGNEVNDYFYAHPDDLDSYLSLYDEAYAAIKKVSPNTKVFVVFSYEHLIENNQFDLLAKFDNRVGLVGLTIYPWENFSSPGDMPADYYTRLDNYTSKPIAFTEVGFHHQKLEVLKQFRLIFFQDSWI